MEKTPNIELKRTQFKAHIRDNIIKLKELRIKAIEARENAGRKILNAFQQGLEGEEFRGEFILNPKEKGQLALLQLSEDTLGAVDAHGVASNLPTQDKDFPINALVNILATGIVKGDSTLLSGGVNQSVFTDAPFILLSNKDQPLTERASDGSLKLTNLRTVLVNGQYEGVVEDLRQAFPWVSFRTAEQITDEVFEKKEPIYKSYDERIEEEIKKS